MKLINEFIGLNDANTLLKFLPGDSEDRFLENLKKEGKDWYYRTSEITYSINENGHRCKSIKDIDLSNYILFTGCSHTTGIGIALEKGYPHLVSDVLKCDYYNISMPGTGIDILEYNLMMWFSKVKEKPKLVVIQMPDHTRFSTRKIYGPQNFFVESGSWSTDKEELQMVLNLEDIGFFNARKYFTYKNLANVIDVPIIMINIHGQDNFVNYDLKMRKRDLARDLSHFGIESNKEFAKVLANKISLRHPTLFE